MEAGPNAGVCNFLSKIRRAGPTMCYTRSCRACDHDLGNVIGPERRPDDTCDAATHDAVRTWVFWVHRRVGDRLPSGLAIRGRVAIDIAVPNCRDGSPEIVVILGIQHGDQCVIDRNPRERHETRALADSHLLGSRELP